jgi:hypothetical protein
MFRKLLAVVVALFVFVGGTFAAEYKGRITKIDGDKITVLVGKTKTEKGEEKTFTAAPSLKVVKVVKKVEEAVADGLKNEAFTTIGKGGIGATLVTTGEGKDEKVTEIKLAGGGKKKPKTK